MHENLACVPAVVTKYQKRIPGLFWIEWISMWKFPESILSNDRLGETSPSIWTHIQTAQEIQARRFSNYSSDIVCNADRRVGEIRQFCKVHDVDQIRYGQRGVSSTCRRAYYCPRSVKLARTIADLLCQAPSNDSRMARNWDCITYRNVSPVDWLYTATN